MEARSSAKLPGERVQDLLCGIAGRGFAHRFPARLGGGLVQDRDDLRIGQLDAVRARDAVAFTDFFFDRSHDRDEEWRFGESDFRHG